MSQFSNSSSPRNSISPVTRARIVRVIKSNDIRWAGELSEVDFLSNLYDLPALLPIDSAYDNAANEIQAWENSSGRYFGLSDQMWVFADPRFQLNDGPDNILLAFLSHMAHPLVMPNRDDAELLIKSFNDLLVHDGWEIIETSRISSQSVYGPRRIGIPQNAINAAKSIATTIDTDYINRQVDRMESAIDSDSSLAIGTAKELIETICHFILDELGKPVTDKPDLLPLLRRVQEALSLLPENIDAQTKGVKSIKSILGSLTSIAQGLTELRNLYGTGHGKPHSAKGLNSRHARLAVGAATTLVVFLYETHMERKSQDPPMIG